MSRATTTSTSYCYSDPTELENRSSSRYFVIDETGFAWGIGDTHRRRNLPTTTVSTTIATTTVSITIVATTPASGGHN